MAYKLMIILYLSVEVKVDGNKLAATLHVCCLAFTLTTL